MVEPACRAAGRGGGMSSRLVVLLLVVGTVFGLLVAAVIDAWSPAADRAPFFVYSLLAGTYLAALLLGCINGIGEELRKRGELAEERRAGGRAA